MKPIKTAMIFASFDKCEYFRTRCGFKLKKKNKIIVLLF